MRLYLKLALGNVRKSARDYSVYFATLGFAACLLYAFTASTDYLMALDLTEAQRGVLGSARDVLEAFSVFTVLVFIFLVRYANTFLVRRRKREFALYELAGMGRAGVASVLVGESACVGAVALAAGIAVGALLSPAFGAAAAFVFDVPWRFALVFSSHAALWTAGCFAVVFALGALASVRDVTRRPLIELIGADRMPEGMGGKSLLARIFRSFSTAAWKPGVAKAASRVFAAVQLLVAAALLAVVWGACVAYPMYFIMLIMPLGFAACIATGILARLGVRAWAWLARRHEGRYWDGLSAFTVRQVEARISSSSMALACVCVLIAAAVCMIVAGFAFSVGLRATGEFSADVTSSMAAIGYVGIFYGAVFLLSAVAVLALQQLSGAVDARRSFEVLDQLGCDRALMCGSIRRQVRLYFGAPLAGALVHDVFGLVLVAFLASAFGSAAFGTIVAGTLAFTVALMVAYAALTARAVERAVLHRGSSR